MELELTRKQLRRLLDMVYIGNWILNSTRGEDRFKDYDEVESLLFAKAAQEGMPTLAETYRGEVIPSRAFAEGGIHEAIMEYENNVFFEILAEDLAERESENKDRGRMNALKEYIQMISEEMAILDSKVKDENVTADDD